MRRGFTNDPLRDLELELEVLKRKRQVLQEKRQIMEEQREFDRAKHQHSPWASSTNETVLPFNQTSYTSNVDFGNSKNFQNHSNGGRRGGGRGSTYSSRNFGTKRPAPIDSSWNPPEKRFAGFFRGGSAKKSKQAYVTKPFIDKSVPRPETPLKVEGPAPLTKKTDQNLVLRSNAPISNQLMGRLELLLGHILKQLKSICQGPPIKKTTFSNEVLFSVKQEIRARIQNALLNKEVSGSIPCNLVHYRKMYPIETDKELIDMMVVDVVFPPHVDKAKAPEKEVEQKPIMRSDTELFKKYVKHQFDTALKTKVSEMFEKLQKLYDDEINKSDEIEKTPCESDTVTENLVTDSKGTLSFEDSEFEKKIEALIRKKLYTLLPQYKQFLKNMLKTPQLLNDIIKQYGKGETPLLIEDKELAPESAHEDNQNEQESAESPHHASSLFVNLEQSSSYVARVVGHPCLLPRDVMKEFLNKFDPISIKKYSWAHNVLYVELPNEKCFNSLMAANGTCIDNIRIIVKRQSVENYKKKRSNSKTDSTEIMKTNGEGEINDTSNNVKQEKVDDNVMEEKVRDDGENTENEKDNLVEVNDTDNPEAITESITQTFKEKDGIGPVNDDHTDDVDLEEISIDQNEPGNIKNEPDHLDNDPTIDDVDLNEINVNKDETGNIKNESNDKKQLDDSLNVNKDESMKRDQQKENDFVIIEDNKEVKIANENTKKDVSKETVIEVIDVTDEGWNTDSKDDWADLKEKDSNEEIKNEPSTPVRVTRSSKRFLSDENK